MSACFTWFLACSYRLYGSAVLEEYEEICSDSDIS